MALFRSTDAFSVSFAHSWILDAFIMALFQCLWLMSLALVPFPVSRHISGSLTRFQCLGALLDPWRFSRAPGALPVPWRIPGFLTHFELSSAFPVPWRLSRAHLVNESAQHVSCLSGFFENSRSPDVNGATRMTPDKPSGWQAAKSTAAVVPIL